MSADLVFNHATVRIFVRTIEVHGNPAEVLQRLDRMMDAINMLRVQGAIEMSALDDLEAKVTAQETVEDSAITLLQTIKAELDAAIAAGDTARIQALSDKIGSDTQKLADAVTANTPAG